MTKFRFDRQFALEVSYPEISFVGTHEGGEEDKFPEMLEGNYWKHYFEGRDSRGEKARARTLSLRPGAVLVVKSKTNKGLIKVRAIGVVLDSSKDGCSVPVDWVIPEVRREHYSAWKTEHPEKGLYVHIKGLSDVLGSISAPIEWGDFDEGDEYSGPHAPLSDLIWKGIAEFLCTHISTVSPIRRR